MGRFIATRVLQGIVSIWLISIFIFGSIRLTGDPASFMASQEATEADIQAVRVRYGLDKPIPVQYGIYLRDILRGDFGVSMRWGNKPALDLFMERFPATLQLSAAGLGLSLVVGVALGVIAAFRPNGLVDRFGRFFAILGQSLPVFWVGMLLILVFAVKLGWLPPAGGPREGIQYLIMPTITLALFFTAAKFRLTRSSMLDVLGSEYIKMGKLKGMPTSVLIWKHALKNASIPLIALFSANFARLLTGTVVTETIFAWPGIGRFMVDAVLFRDYVVIQAIVLFAAFFIVVTFVLVDMMYGVMDPRIRLARAKG